MGYMTRITIKLKNPKRSTLSEENSVKVLKRVTHLRDLTLLQDHTKKVFNGESVSIHPRNTTDSKQAFEHAKTLESAGLAAQVTVWIRGFDLPFLIDKKGIIPGTEDPERQLQTYEEVEAILNDARVLVTGFGMDIEWIPDIKKWAYWKSEIRDRFNIRDHHTYTAYEWLTKDGQRFILLWFWH